MFVAWCADIQRFLRIDGRPAGLRDPGSAALALLHERPAHV
jgi:hypothetical protein